MAASSPNSAKQSVYIVRYGLTEFPLLENLGPFDSDLDPTEGIVHAKAIASKIRKDEQETQNTSPLLIYSSPFVRTAHTAHMIALEMNASVHVEEGLTEWQIPSLLVVESTGQRTIPQAASALVSVYGTINPNYQSLNPAVADNAKNVPVGAPHFPETEEALLQRCAVTLSRILKHADGNSLVIVSHAPCDQALALKLEGVGVQKTSLGPWPMGGITKFSRQCQTTASAECTNNGEWQIDYYGNTEHMPGKWKAGLKEWSLPLLSSRQS